MPKTAEISSPSAPTPLPSRRQFLTMLAIMLACVSLFAWGGSVFLPPAALSYTREIVHDYDTATDTLVAKLDGTQEVRQRMYVEGPLYGVRLCIATFERVAHGTLHLTLENENQEVVAQSNTDMTLLKDKTFHPFIFDDMLDAGAGNWYVLVISTTPASPADIIGVHHSINAAIDFYEPETGINHYTLDDFVLEQSGQIQEGALALQYITQYAGGASSFIFGAYAFFAAFITALLLALYWMIFVLRAPLHRVFILAALGLGFVFAFLTPPLSAPDEYVHVATSYQHANKLLGRAEQGGTDTVTVRAGDEMMLYNYNYNGSDVYAYQRVAENLFQRAPAGDDIVLDARVASVFPPLYVVPTLGILLAQLLGVGQAALLLMGRMANLAFYTFVVSRAIKKMPFAKPLLFSVALLPMCLQIAASFSYDTWLLALCFYFISACLRYAQPHSAPLGLPQIAMLVVLSMLIAPAKTVYIMVLPLVFIIPAMRYKNRRQCISARSVILASALAMWFIFNLSGVWSTAIGPSLSPAATPTATAAYTPVNPTIQSSNIANHNTPTTYQTPEANSSNDVHIDENGIAIGENGDALEFYSLKYIITHLPKTLKLVIHTLWQESQLWLQGMLGGRLGEIIAVKIEVNWLFIIGILGILLASSLPDKEDRQLLKPRQRLFTLAISITVFALFCLACLLWTPINYKTVFGIQGRYFLPVLPLALLAARGGSLRFSKPLWRKLAYALCVLVTLCQLDAFFIIIAR